MNNNRLRRPTILRGRLLLSLLAAMAISPLGCAPTGATIDDLANDGAGEPDASTDSSASDGGGGDARDGGVVDPDEPGEPCTPKACADFQAECGFIADGCGEVVSCGDCTEEGETCGGSGLANRCGGPCKPRSCDDLGADCGMQGDGCGGAIHCGTCSGIEYCGGGGANVCGFTISKPDCKTEAEACDALGYECGPIGDGCGETLSCGSCPEGMSCGGGGIPFRCGKASVCVPKSCGDFGYDCGKATDGCGNVIDCGPVDCGPGKVCGGAGDNRCGGSGSVGTDPCEGGTTTVSGTVFMPNGEVPLYGALVYVPKSLADIPAFADNVACERCDAQVPPTALAHAVTGPDGKFTLSGVPAGQVPLVIQVGRWRRKVDIHVNACQSHDLPASTTRLAKRHNEASIYDNIPKIGMVTGLVDALECVLRRVGIDDDQFSKPAGTGRIHIVQADSYGGSRGPKLNASDTSQPRGVEIYGNATKLSTYDMVLLACQSLEVTQSDANINRLKDYVDAGGRVFATHYSYKWLNKLDPFKSTATWQTGNASWSAGIGTVDTSFAKGQAFADWLRVVGANISGNPAITQINILEPRNSVLAVAASARQWIWTTQGGKNYVQHMTFNTPVGMPVDQQCGRVVFSDFHVTGGSSLSSKNFPEECAGSTTLSPQEKALAFMLFDLASCIQSDGATPKCMPKSCVQQGISCGNAGDGCGEIIDCGSCGEGLSCGGGGVAGQCGKQGCEKLDCDDYGFECGPAGDGCGGIIECGECPVGQSCGGGGLGLCGTPPCKKLSCTDRGIGCGPAGDGCGDLLDCGTCPPDESCGGGGVPGQCGGGQCKPKSCSDLGFECGPAADGCGKLLDCGTCPAPKSCGGDGRAGKCGGVK